MSKQIIVVAVIVILLGAGGFFFMSKDSTNTKSPTDEVSQEGMTEKTGGPKSIKDLFSLGTAQQCTFKDTAENGGTVYVSGGKMRGDFTTVSGNKTIQSHMIRDDKTSYVWMEGETMGYKMSVESTNQTSPQGGTTNTQGSIDLDKKADYSCKPWVVSESMFQMPSNVQFTDLNAMMQQSPPQGGTQDMKSIQCAACDTVPELTPRAQCRAALSCN
ncbi:MAG: hypothetical protein Q7S61_02680 [bacterium]|nr:hypothetical protein [bacterium]